MSISEITSKGTFIKVKKDKNTSGLQQRYHFVFKCGQCNAEVEHLLEYAFMGVNKKKITPICPKCEVRNKFDLTKLELNMN
jgi:transcription elongation factor Elf1